VFAKSVICESTQNASIARILLNIAQEMRLAILFNQDYIVEIRILSKIVSVYLVLPSISAVKLMDLVLFAKTGLPTMVLSVFARLRTKS
jgi:hypothetical protein